MRLGIVAAFVGSGVAAADCNELLLYDNGFPNGCNGVSAQLGGQIDDSEAADDFGDLGGATIGAVHWYTLDPPTGFGYSDRVEVRLYVEDAANPGLPEAAPYLSKIVPDDEGLVTRTTIQSPGPFGFDRVRYDATCLDCPTQAGVNNYLAVRPLAVDGAVGQTFWETSRCGAHGDTIAGNQIAFRGEIFGLPDWVAGDTVFGDEYDLNFQLAECVEGGGPCPCDLDGDGSLNVSDLLTLLVDCWLDPCGDCTGDGVGNVPDLLAILTDPRFGGPCGGPDIENDLCENALLILDGVHIFDTTNAATDGRPDAECFFFGSDQVFNDIWYCLKAEATTSYSVSLCGSSYDTKVAVYSTVGNCELGEIIACNDDFCGVRSTVFFTAVEGDHYKIRVGGFGEGAGGRGALAIFAGSPPFLGTCENPIDIVIGETVEQGDTTGFADSGQVPCNVSPGQGMFWHRVIGDGTTLTATTCSPRTGDTNLYVLCGSSCNDLVCVGRPYVQDNDVLCPEAPLSSSVTWCSIAGRSYWIPVQGNGGPVQFSLTVTSDGVPCADPEACILGGPPNDLCEDRFAIGDGDTAFTTITAGTDGVPHGACQFDGQTYADIWFDYTATCDGLLTVSTCNTVDYDSDLVVYAGCDTASCPPGDADLLGCNDDGAGCAGFSSLVQVPVAAGQCYRIRVGGWMDGDEGSGTLNLSCEIAQGACSAPAFLVPGTTGAIRCPESVEIALPTGDWVAFAAPNAFTCYVCGVNSAFWLSLECTP